MHYILWSWMQSSKNKFALPVGPWVWMGVFGGLQSADIWQNNYVKDCFISSSRKWGVQRCGLCLCCRIRIGKENWRFTYTKGTGRFLVMLQTWNWYALCRGIKNTKQTNKKKNQTYDLGIAVSWFRGKVGDRKMSSLLYVWLTGAVSVSFGCRISQTIGLLAFIVKKKKVSSRWWVFPFNLCI